MGFRCPPSVSRVKLSWLLQWIQCSREYWQGLVYLTLPLWPPAPLVITAYLSLMRFRYLSLKLWKDTRQFSCITKIRLPTVSIQWSFMTIWCLVAEKNTFQCLIRPNHKEQNCLIMSPSGVASPFSWIGVGKWLFCDLFFPIFYNYQSAQSVQDVQSTS